MSETLLRQLAEVLPEEMKAEFWEDGSNWDTAPCIAFGVTHHQDEQGEWWANQDATLTLIDDHADAPAKEILLDHLESLGYTRYSFKRSRSGDVLFFCTHPREGELGGTGKTRSEAVARALISAVQTGGER